MDADRRCTDAQACKGCMTNLAIVAAVVRDRRLAARAKDLRPIRPKSRQLAESMVSPIGPCGRAADASSKPTPPKAARLWFESIPFQEKKDLVSH
jgi:hypothetical protein